MGESSKRRQVQAIVTNIVTCRLSSNQSSEMIRGRLRWYFNTKVFSLKSIRRIQHFSLTLIESHIYAIEINYSSDLKIPHTIFQKD
jgi:hypothetical protein